MYTGLLHLHSTLRWILLVLLVVLLIRSIMGRSGNLPFNAQDRKLSLWLTITAHLQLLIGLYQYFSGAWGIKMLDNMAMGEVMKNKMARFFVIEHFVGMLAAIVLITIASAYTKKSVEDKVKWNRLASLYGIAFLLLMACIPWPFREVGFGRTWFPGM